MLDQHPYILGLHIATYLLGVAAIGVAFIFSCMQIFQHLTIKSKRSTSGLNWLPPLLQLDKWSHRSVAFGFPFMTAGLILGVVLAHKAWPNDWIRDPFVILSTALWLWYTALIVSRWWLGIRGHRFSWYTVIGFVVVVVTMFGLGSYFDFVYHEIF